VRAIAEEVRRIASRHPDVRDAFLDWGERASAYRLVLDQDRLRLLGFTPADVKLQVNALLTGNPITEVREGIRTVPVLARAIHQQRESLEARRLTITNAAASVPGRSAASSRHGGSILAAQPRDHDRGAPHRRRKAAARCRAGSPCTALRADRGASGAIASTSAARSKMAGRALAALFPIMILLTLVAIMLQVRSFGAMFMVSRPRCSG
jgi:multidrug efflux pump subunit AcrB